VRLFAQTNVCIFFGDMICLMPCDCDCCIYCVVVVCCSLFAGCWLVVLPPFFPPTRAVVVCGRGRADDHQGLCGRDAADDAGVRARHGGAGAGAGFWGGGGIVAGRSTVLGVGIDSAGRWDRQCWALGSTVLGIGIDSAGRWDRQCWALGSTVLGLTLAVPGCAWLGSAFECVLIMCPGVFEPYPYADGIAIR
jgi:hypothetical protein